jgi:hypothetical protein
VRKWMIWAESWFCDSKDQSRISDKVHGDVAKTLLERINERISDLSEAEIRKRTTTFI